MNHLVAPSLLSANFGCLKSDIEMLNKSCADWYHIDVMDGVFVPNISLGFSVINYINKIAKKPLDVHLMIVRPERYFSQFKESGASILTIHYEACVHLHRAINNIKSLGMKAGVALNPHSNINLLEDIIQDLDLVLLMSVNPGFGGQSFIENTYSKIKKLRQLIVANKSNALIEVDGGVDTINAKKLIKVGVDVLVAGNVVFNAKFPEQIIYSLKN